MFKNVDSQKVAVFAWDQSSGAAKTGDAAQISAQISKDGGACAATNDAAPTELDSTDAPGIYIFDMLQAETNADLVVITPVSSTTDITFRPLIIYTQVAQTGDTFDRLGAPAGASIAADLLTIDNFVDALETRLSAARAGYLDELAAANIPTDIDNIVIAIGALNNITAANVKTAMEADGGDLSSLMEALVNKRIWTEATGNLEMHNDAGVYQGTIASQVTTDGTFTTAKRAVI